MNQDFTIDLKDALLFLLRGLLPAILLAGAVASGVFFLSRSQDLIYETRATVLAAQQNSGLESFGVSLVAAPPLDALAYRAAVNSDPVIENAARQLGDDLSDPATISRLRDRFQVRTEETRTSALIHIDVSGSSADRARQAANALAHALVRWDQNRAEASLTRAVTALEQQIAALDEQIQSLTQQENVNQMQIDSRLLLRGEQQQQLFNARALRNSAVGNLEVVQPAPVARGRYPYSPTVGAAISFLLVASLVYGLMLLRRALDNRLRTIEEVADATGLPVLGQFMRNDVEGRRLPIEASHFLRTNLELVTKDAGTLVLLVTSARAAEGKSSVSLSLAESFARNGKFTLLIDADLRSPALSSEFVLPGNPSTLKQYLEWPNEPFRPAVVPVTSSRNLHFIPTWTPVPAATDLLGEGIRERIRMWKEDYDVVIIDSPPVLAVADPLVIAPYCTGVLMVASIASANQAALRAATDLLKRTGAPILGMAINHVAEAERGSTTYGSSYGYGYGYGSQQRT